MHYPWSYIPKWIDQEETVYLKEKLLSDLEWLQPNVVVFNHKYKVPRLTTFLANKGVTYEYSGTIHMPNEWPEWFIPLLIKVSEYCQINFNGCLINLYRNGDDRMGWHSDNERELDPCKSIACLSLGATRCFHLKHRNGLYKKSIELKDGDLLLMHPDCNAKWLHCLPSRKRVKYDRISLTFRRYLNN